jgi:hypothetical protein
MQKYYSTTYTAEIMKLLGVFALILNFDLPDETEAIVGALVVLGGALYTMYQRYKSGKEGRAGAVNLLGLRK